MGVLDKSVAVLEAVAEGAGTVGELVAATGLSRSTAHRLAGALEAHGLLGRDPGGRWRLGLRLLALGTRAGQALRDALREVARPALERLRDRTGESAQLFVRVGDSRVCVEVAESDRELRTTVPLGAELPLTAGSAGKVFMAFATDRDRLLEAARPLTERTPTGDRLGRQVHMAGRRGWAESVGERERGVASVSAPVVDALGVLVAVVSVSGPVQRLGPRPGRYYAPAVTAAAKEIASVLGYASQGVR